MRLRRALRRLNASTYRIIQEHRAGGKDRGDLLSMLIAAQEEDGSTMTDRQLRDELITFYFGGHETTALTLTWTWYLMAEHPEIEEKLLLEFDTVLGERAPAAADLPDLQSAEAVIKETLRLYPPTWIFQRQAVGACDIGGYRLTAGMQVRLSPWVVHRDPRFFEDPDIFRPERWLDGSTRDLPRLAYFPFGGGQRKCTGSDFAVTEAVLILATIARRFRLVLAPDETVTPQGSLTLRPKDGLKCTGGEPDFVHSGRLLEALNESSCRPMSATEVACGAPR